jgi:hypothetical protein
MITLSSISHSLGSCSFQQGRHELGSRLVVSMSVFRNPIPAMTILTFDPSSTRISLAPFRASITLGFGAEATTATVTSHPVTTDHSSSSTISLHDPIERIA